MFFLSAAAFAASFLNKRGKFNNFFRYSAKLLLLFSTQPCAERSFHHSFYYYIACIPLFDHHSFPMEHICHAE